jgi:hypothetical protein
VFLSDHLGNPPYFLVEKRGEVGKSSPKTLFMQQSRELRLTSRCSRPRYREPFGGLRRF